MTNGFEAAAENVSGTSAGGANMTCAVCTKKKLRFIILTRETMPYHYVTGVSDKHNNRFWLDVTV